MGLLDRIRGTEATDVVCGMKVSTTNPPGGASLHKGDTFYFCSAACKRQFDADPEKWLAKVGHGGHAGPHP